MSLLESFSFNTKESFVKKKKCFELKKKLLELYYFLLKKYSSPTPTTKKCQTSASKICKGKIALNFLLSIAHWGATGMLVGTIIWVQTCLVQSRIYIGILSAHAPDTCLPLFPSQTRGAGLAKEDSTLRACLFHSHPAGGLWFPGLVQL